MDGPRTVLLITSDDIGWHEVRSILASLPDVQIVGDTLDLRQARCLAIQHHPSFIITAAQPAGGAISPLLNDLHRDHCPQTRCILLARNHIPQALLSIDPARIVGMLLWNDLSRTVLRDALAVLLASDVFLSSRAVVAALLATLRHEGSVAVDRLTAREDTVLMLLATGRTQEEIAIAEGFSVRTVKRTIANMEEKLAAPNLFLLGMRAAILGVRGEDTAADNPGFDHGQR